MFKVSITDKVQAVDVTMEKEPVDGVTMTVFGSTHNVIQVINTQEHGTEDFVVVVKGKV